MMPKQSSFFALMCCLSVAVVPAVADVHRPGHAYVPAKWGSMPKINTQGGVQDFKAIKLFAIPPHWEGGSSHRLSRDAYEFRWNREGEKSVELKVRVITRPMSDAIRMKLKAIIFAAKCHRLTAPEIKSLEAALRPPDTQQGFPAQYKELEVDSAETRDIDGVRILSFVSTSGALQETVMIPLDDTCTNFQEVIYSADSSAKFEANRKETQKALASLRLKHP